MHQPPKYLHDTHSSSVQQALPGTQATSFSQNAFYYLSSIQLLSHVQLFAAP